MSARICQHVFTDPIPGWAWCQRCDLHVPLMYDGTRPEWQQPTPPAPPPGRLTGTARLKTAQGWPLRLRVPGETAAACVQTLQALMAAFTGGAQ